MAKGGDIEKAYALIIGISEYEDPKIPGLKYTHADAEGIFKLLTDPKKLGLSKDKIKILLDKDATQFNIKNAISSWLFKNADENSVVFIFFAGHGGVEEDRLRLEKDNLAKYLLPYDAVFEDLFSSAISNRDFNDLLFTIRSKKLVIFMDSCYSGGVSERKARDMKIVEDPYQKLAEGEGRIVIAASQPNQRSFEDSTIGHGVFTYNLLEALSGKADLDNDGYVSVIDAWKYLEDAVPRDAMKLAGGKQEPIICGDMTKDFVISIDRERFEKIDRDKVIQVNISKLLEIRNQNQISGKQYARLRNIVKTDFEKLSDKDKKISKLIDDFLSEYISVTIFTEDLEIIDPELFEKPEEERQQLEKQKKAEVLQEQVKEFYNKGKQAVKSKEWEAAIAAFQEVVALDSQYKDASNLLATATAEFEKIEDAKIKIQEQVKEFYNKGKSAARSKDWDEAIAAFREVVALDSQYKDTSNLLATAKAELEKIEDAKIKTPEQVKEFYTKGKSAVRSKDWEAAIAAFQEVVALDSQYKDASKLLTFAESELNKIKEDEKNGELLEGLYARITEANADKNWTLVISIGREILAINPDHKNVADLIDNAKTTIMQHEEAEKKNALKEKKDRRDIEVKKKTFKKTKIKTQEEENRLDVEKGVTEGLGTDEGERKARDEAKRNGDALLDSEKFQEAINEYDKALEIDTNYEEAWNGKGDALYSSGKYQEAINAYDKVLEIDQNYNEAWKNKGVVLYSLEKYEEAISAFDKALEIDINYKDAWNGKGETLNKLGKYDEAIIAFDKALVNDSKYKEAWNGKGETLIYLGKYDEAINAFDKALEFDPNNKNAWNGKGVALWFSGKYQEAIIEYDKVLEIDPKNEQSWKYKGYALKVLGKFEEAINAFDKALEIESNYGDAWNGKGETLNHLGKYDEAISAFDKALELDTNYKFAWIGKGYALKLLGKYQEAINAYDKALKIDPNDKNAWNGKGETLNYLGKYDEAINAYDKARKIDPGDKVIWDNKSCALNNLGNAHYSSGKYQEAINAYDKALKINPNDKVVWGNESSALNQLGNAHYSSGKYQDAINAYNKALKINPKDKVVWGNKSSALNQLGNAHYSSGKYQDAIRAFDKALEIDPNYKDALENREKAIKKSRGFLGGLFSSKK